MSVRLTNKSGGQLVCDLSVKGKTLRLDNNKSTTIKDTEMTPHIVHLVQCGLMLKETVAEEIPATKSTSKRSANKEKEE